MWGHVSNIPSSYYTPFITSLKQWCCFNATLSQTVFSIRHAPKRPRFVVYVQGLIDFLPIRNVRTLVPQIRTLEGMGPKKITNHMESPAAAYIPAALL